VTIASTCSAVLKVCEGTREKRFRAVTTVNRAACRSSVSILALAGAKITAGDSESETLAVGWGSGGALPRAHQIGRLT
jgi:hypothetical protein